MAFQPVPDVAQVVCEGRQDNQLCILDLSFAISGGGITPTNIQALNTAVKNWFTGALIPILSQDFTAVRTRAFDLGAADGPYNEQQATATGGEASEAAPNNVAACVSFRTAQRGRSARGRNYVPGIPNPLVTLNTMDSAFIASLETVYGGLIGAGTFLAGWQWVVVSRQTGGALRPAGIAIPITAAFCTTPYVRSMRSREVGHGA